MFPRRRFSDCVYFSFHIYFYSSIFISVIYTGALLEVCVSTGRKYMSMSQGQKNINRRASQMKLLYWSFPEMDDCA